MKARTKAKSHRTLRKLHLDKRVWTFPGITPGKEAVLDEIVRLILQALELFDIRVKDGKRGVVRAPQANDGFTYFEMPEDG